MKQGILLVLLMNSTLLYSGNFFKQSGIMIVDKLTTVALTGGVVACFWHFGVVSKLTAGFLASIRTNLDASTKQEIADLGKGVLDLNNFRKSVNEKITLREKQWTMHIQKIEHDFSNFGARLSTVEKEVSQMHRELANVKKDIAILQKLDKHNSSFTARTEQGYSFLKNKPYFNFETFTKSRLMPFRTRPNITNKAIAPKKNDTNTGLKLLIQ